VLKGGIMLTTVPKGEQQSQALEAMETLLKFTQDLPLFQYIGDRSTTDKVEVYHRCKLRTRQQLEEHKKHYQQVYFLVDSIEAKRNLFRYLGKLNYRISRFQSDNRRFH